MVGYRPDGKPDVREVTARSQKLCRERLDAVKTQASNGTLPSADLAGLTVGRFLDRWLATVKPKLRVTTYQRYEQFVIAHFKPALGSKRLAKLTHDDVQAFLNAKRDEKRNRGKSERWLAPALSTTCTWSSARP